MWWDVSKNVICVSNEHGCGEVFGEEIGQINRCMDAFQMEEVPFYPFTDDLVFDIHMACTRGRLLGHGHRSAGIIILI